MLPTEDVTVSEIAARSLAAVRVFDRLGIDYCCGGKRPLADVCREKGYDVDAVRVELQQAADAPVEEARDWNTAPLRELIGHILEKHHEYLKRELGPLAARVEKVHRVYNQKYGETLTGLPQVFQQLRSELELHLRKEEIILFPAIVQYEAGSRRQTCFGSMANPVRMMEIEHDDAGAALARIREITSDYAVPDYACVTYRALMAGLEELERDLHMHIHLENNVLFPRALELEAA